MTVEATADLPLTIHCVEYKDGVPTTLQEGDAEEVPLIPKVGVRVMLAAKDRDRDADEV